MDWLTIVLLFILAILVIYEIYLRSLPSNLAAKHFPGPRRWPVLGNAPILLFHDQVSSFRLARRLAQKYNDSYRIVVRGGFIFNAIRARETEALLSSMKFVDKSLLYKFLYPFLGLGLLTSTGTKWFHRRKILTAAFHFNILPKFLVTFQEECDKLLRTLDMDARQGCTTTLQSLAARFTLNTVCEAAMGVKLDSMSMADEYRTKIQELVKLLFQRLMNPWLVEDFTYKLFGLKARVDKLLKPVHAFSKGVIKHRRELFHANVKNLDEFSEENIYTNTNQRYALLDTLLANEAKNQIDEEGIREEVDTFMFEGHDTTASAFTFMFLVIANHQDAQQLLFEEIEAIIEGRDEPRDSPFSMKNYNDLKYMDRVLKEVLRLYPSVPFISRQVKDEAWFGDRLIPSDTIANVHIYDLHRDPEQFPDPEQFDPDRFLPEQVERRNPYAYVPFSAGPRNCIGKKIM